MIQIGSAPAATGDIEVDLQAGGWRAHGHDKNPNFKNVILHVIWDGIDENPTSRRLPTAVQSETGLIPPAAVAIRGKLDAPLAELTAWLSSEAPESFPESLRGQCSAPLSEMPPEKGRELLLQAAQIRFRSKAAQLQARARHVGWEQALWEGLFRALGYKHNAWPMQYLAENRSRWHTRRSTPLELQARLLGVAGLLPTELTRGEAGVDGYVRAVWDHWWRERETFSDCVVPRGTWRFHGQRPANHPQRRIALAAHWLAANRLSGGVERWCARKFSDGEMAPALLELFQTEPDEFWSWHWTIRSPRLKKPQPLLGAARMTDLSINVVLPWLWVRAFEGRNSALQREIENRFNTWPAAEDNAVLRLARQRLLGGASRRSLRSAAEQQGLIQIVRDFCDHSNAICENCRFPELVRGFVAGRQ